MKHQRKIRQRPNAERERRDVPKGQTLDFHRSPAEAAACLIACEGLRLRGFTRLVEPACGDGALVIPFRQAGFRVAASDIEARGCPGQTVADYLAGEPHRRPDEACLTNPPFNRAEEFILRATQEFDYVAMLLRLRYLGAKHLIGPDGLPTRAKGGIPIWNATRIPCARVIIPHGRWPMMHRDGHPNEGTEQSSMMDFAWFIWDASHRGPIQVFMESQLNAAAAAGRDDHA